MPSVGKARPILYVEGELPAADIQIRVSGDIDKINVLFQKVILMF